MESDTRFTHGRKKLQEEGLWTEKQCRALYRDWFDLSVRPLDCGWYPEERLTVNPNALQNTFQFCDMNCSPQSDTMSLRSLCRRKTCLTRNSPFSAAEGSLERGMKCTALENQSTTVRMMEGPPDGGSPVTKSTSSDGERIEEPCG